MPQSPVNGSIRGVFFDLYGTLLTYGDMKSAWSDWLFELHGQLQTMGHRMSIEELSSACDGFFGRSRPSAVDGQTIYESRIERLCLELGIRAGSQDLARLADSTIEVWQAHVDLDPSAMTTLRKLSGSVSVALVTNFDHPRHVRSLLSALGLDGFFETVLISGDTDFEKPDPRIFDAPLSSLGLSPSEVVYVGDAQVDVDAARGAGIHPILIERASGATDHANLDFKSDARSAVQLSVDGLDTVANLDEVLSLVPTQ